MTWSRDVTSQYQVVVSGTIDGRAKFLDRGISLRGIPRYIVPGLRFSTNMTSTTIATFMLFTTAHEYRDETKHSIFLLPGLSPQCDSTLIGRYQGREVCSLFPQYLVFQHIHLCTPSDVCHRMRFRTAQTPNIPGCKLNSEKK